MILPPVSPISIGDEKEFPESVLFAKKMLVPSFHTTNISDPDATMSGKVDAVPAVPLRSFFASNVSPLSVLRINEMSFPSSHTT